MVELIIVIILIGILGAIGAGRYFNRSGFDAAAFAEQSAAMLRYAQKLAIAQNRPVYVQSSTSGISLCYTGANPCGVADRVQAPSGANSGSAGTRTFCTGGGAYDPLWNCEGVPTGAALTLNSAAPAIMYFNGLGRPYVSTDSGSGDSSFVSLTLTIKGDDVTRTVSVARETGYVF
jgi:MSHA pilin protein MshC